MRDELFYHGELIKTYNLKEIAQPGFYKIQYSSDMHFPVLPQKTIDRGLVFINGYFLRGIY
jgi:hypothetical protein